MISDVLLDRVTRRIVDEARPERVILFGSTARGDGDEDSDLDLLVVLKQVGSRHAEIVKLYEALRDLRVPADILVYSEQEIEEWGHLAGSTMYEALVEGEVLYDAA